MLSRASIRCFVVLAFAVIALGACQSVRRTTDVNDRTQTRETVALLERGVARVGRAAARRNIEAWQQRLRTPDAADLDAVAATLDDLEAALAEDTVDAQATGAILEKLATQTRAAARQRPDAPERLGRLAALLAQAGERLRA